MSPFNIGSWLRGEHLVPALSDPPIIKYFSKEDSVDLGYVKTTSGKNLEARISIKDFLHGLILGTTGSGKSTLALKIVCEILKLKNANVVLFDPHGSLVEDIMPWCFALGKKVVLIDLAFSSGKVAPWNFLLPSDMCSEDVSSFVVDSFDSVFGVSKTVRILESLLHGFTALSSARMTIAEFSRLFRDRTFRDYVLAQTESLNAKEFFSNYETLSNSQQQQYASGSINKISLLLQNKSTRYIFCQPTSIPLRKIINDPKQVILVSLNRKVSPLLPISTRQQSFIRRWEKSSATVLIIMSA